MRYAMKQKVWSWSESFAIKNDADETMFSVTAKAWSFFKKLDFYDADGNELARIEQQMAAWGPKYHIYKGDELAGVVEQQLTFWKKKFTVDVPGPLDFTATGSFWEYEYSFERGGNVVARVSKEAWTLADTYAIDIDDDQDAIVILAAAVVIDLVAQDR